MQDSQNTCSFDDIWKAGLLNGRDVVSDQHDEEWKIYGRYGCFK